jgi:hypothetical protein
MNQKQKDTIREELFYESGLEDLLVTAELGHLAKDPKKHKEEIRGLIKGIEEWVISKLDQAYQLGAKDKVEEVGELIENSKDGSDHDTLLDYVIKRLK